MKLDQSNLLFEKKHPQSLILKLLEKSGELRGILVRLVPDHFWGEKSQNEG